MIGRYLLSELVKGGYNFTEENIIFITKDSEGQLIWLERGNENVGLQHIVARHKMNFEMAFNIKENEIALYLYDVVTKGKMVQSQPSKVAGGTDRIYEYDNQYYTIIATGSNGFIITSYPTPKPN